MDKIFVIIVTYNASPWLDKCLGSLRATSVPVTPVVVDNNSDDNTLTQIEEDYPEVHAIRSNENLGFGKANNKGIVYSLENGADYLFLLNQDAWVLPNTIEALISVNKAHPEFLVLSPLHLDGSGSRLDYSFSLWVSPDNCPNLISDLIINDEHKDVYPIEVVNAALWLLSKECVLNIGGFDDIFSHYGEDNDFLNRVNFHGYKAGICPEAVGFHDRNQEKLDLDKLPKDKRFNRKYNAHLIILKNINEPYFFGILKIILHLSAEMIKSLLKVRLDHFFVELKIGFSMGMNLGKIHTHRSTSKAVGPSFLKYLLKKSQLIL